MHSNPNYYVIVLIIKNREKSIAQNQKKKSFLKCIPCLLVSLHFRHIASLVAIGTSEIRATL